MITDLEARKLASEWHGGQSTALYALSSSGAIIGEQNDDFYYNSAAEEIRDDLRQNQIDYDRVQLTNDEFFERIDELRKLLFYVLHHGPRGPQPGWNELTW